MDTQGYCECGCGLQTSQATRNYYDRKIPIKKGEYTRFITGHNSRLGTWNQGKHYHQISSGSFKKGSIPWNKGKKNLLISGDKHWNWNNGSSRIYKDGYNSFEYRKWRKDVFERDNYTCKFCKSNGNNTYLTAHHIKSFSKYPNLRFELANGITLCEECHKLTDNYKGRARKENGGVLWR